jgi:hypothetical protein
MGSIVDDGIVNRKQARRVLVRHLAFLQAKLEQKPHNAYLREEITALRYAMLCVDRDLKEYAVSPATRELPRS